MKRPARERRRPLMAAVDFAAVAMTFLSMVRTDGAAERRSRSAGACSARACAALHVIGAATLAVDLRVAVLPPVILPLSGTLFVLAEAAFLALRRLSWGRGAPPCRLMSAGLGFGFCWVIGSSF